MSTQMGTPDYLTGTENMLTPPRRRLIGEGSPDERRGGGLDSYGTLLPGISDRSGHTESGARFGAGFGRTAVRRAQSSHIFASRAAMSAFAAARSFVSVRSASKS